MQTFSKLNKSRSRASQSATPKVQTDFFASNTDILPKKLQKSTHPTTFLPQSFDYGKLLSLIEQQRLTDAIEYLQEIGCTGDAAILVLANLQKVGGAA